MDALVQVLGVVRAVVPAAFASVCGPIGFQWHLQEWGWLGCTQRYSVRRCRQVRGGLTVHRLSDGFDLDPFCARPWRIMGGSSIGLGNATWSGVVHVC